MSSQPGRGARWIPYVLGAVVSVLLILGFALVLPRPSALDSAATSTAGHSASASSDRLAGLQDLLSRRADAARRGDERAWLADLVPGPYRERQRAALTSLRELGADSFSLDLAGPRTAPGPPCTARGPEDVEVDVVGEWGLAGDERPAGRYTLTLVARPAAGGWQLVDDDCLGTMRQAFDLSGLQVRRTPSGTVAGNAAPARLDEYAAALSASRPRVESLWGPGEVTPLVVVPARPDEFGRLTGRDPASSGEVAAVTTGLVQEGRRAVGDAIVVNPASWDRLDEQGRGVVLAHELTHLVIRGSTTHGVPEWLSEGYAVHVSYSGLRVDPRAAAPQLVAQVRRGQVPTALPGDVDFGDAVSGTAYDEAWLAVRHLVDRYGDPAVARFYRDLATGTPAPQAWSRLGCTEQELVQGWQQDLRALT